MINQRQKQKQAEKCNQLGKGMARLWQSAFLLGPLADWTQGGREIVQTRVPGIRLRPAEAHPGQGVTRSHNCTRTHTSVLGYAQHSQPKVLRTCPHLLPGFCPSLPAHSLGTCRWPCTVQTLSSASGFENTYTQCPEQKMKRNACTCCSPDTYPHPHRTHAKDRRKV